MVDELWEIHWQAIGHLFKAVVRGCDDIVNHRIRANDAQ